MSNSMPISATELPPLGNLRSAIDNIRLVDYMMVCSRVPPSYYLPVPPPFNNTHFVEPGSLEEEKEVEELLLGLRNAHEHIQFMLADDLATENEKQRAKEHAALIYLDKWLSKYRWQDIVKMPTPKNMNHLTYIFMFKECDGRNSFDGKYCMFASEENLKRFQTYMETVNSNI